MKCPYDNGEMELVDSAKIYGGKSYGMIWLCENYPICDAFVGCHKGMNKPLGNPARKELRELRKRAHKNFDKTWRDGLHTRKESYKMLSELLNINLDDAHISMLSEEQCKTVIKYFNSEGDRQC